MENIKQNKMGTMPTGKLLVSMSLPVMVSMMVQACYNIVDSIFVARIGEEALAAVTIAFPAQMLMIAVGVGTGIGINSLISRRLGERNFYEANSAATTGLILAVISWAVFAAAGFFFSKAFLLAHTSDSGIVNMGTSYLKICCIFSLGVFVQMSSERIMQATGNTVYNMIVQGTGAIINIIFDPIFIFGYFGVPAMGVAGAAVATVIGQISAALLALWINHKFNKHIHISFRKYKMKKAVVNEIYRVGVPSIIMHSIMSLTNIILNNILLMHSAAAVAVLGVYGKLQSFVFMPVFGLTNGLITIVGYNYGAGDKVRIMETIKKALLLSVCIMAAGMLIFQLFPMRLLGIFKPSPEMERLGIAALRIVSIHFVPAAVSIILSSVFQAVGNGFLSMAISICRQLIVIVPVAYLLSKFVGVHSVWACYPIAEVLSLVMCLLAFRYIYRNSIKPLQKLYT